MRKKKRVTERNPIEKAMIWCTVLFIWSQFAKTKWDEFARCHCFNFTRRFRKAL